MDTEHACTPKAFDTDEGRFWFCPSCGETLTLTPEREAAFLMGEEQMDRALRRMGCALVPIID